MSPAGGRRAETLGLAAVLGAVILGGTFALWSAPAAEAEPQLFFIRRDVIPAGQTDFAQVGDLDGDGDIDVLGVNPDAEDVAWWSNTGVGDDFAKMDITLASNGVRQVAILDHDGDGDLDFAALRTDRSRLDLWANDGAGNFSLVPGFSELVLDVIYVAAFDADGDDFGDLLLLKENGEIRLWINTGESSPEFDDVLVTRRPDVTGNPVQLDAGDIDGDGWTDFATANTAADRFNWWRRVPGQGEPVFERASQLGWREDEVTDVAVVDANGDGRNDLYVLRMAPYKVFLWLQDDNGNFVRFTEELAEVPGGLMWKSIDAGDMDGDGLLDFIVPEAGGRLCWYKNVLEVAPTGTPATTTPTATPTTGDDFRTATPTSSTSPTTGTPTGTGTDTATPVTETPTGSSTLTPSSEPPTLTPTAPTATASGTAATSPPYPTTATATRTPGETVAWLYMPLVLRQK